MPGPSPTTDPTTASAAVTPASVLADIGEILVEVIGEDLDLLLGGDLEPATSFNDDLELESIEFVALAEKLLERYGEQVDFVGWLATMELDDIIALTVGQLVDFVVSAA